MSAKDKLLSVASKTFGKYGFHKTSMDEIAKTARKAKGSLYYHFESKELLFTQVVTFEIMLVKEELEKIISINDVSSQEKLRRYLLKRMELLRNAPNYHETLRADFFEEFDFIDGLRSDMEEWEKRQIKKMIESGVSKGELELSGNIDVIIEVFVMVLQGLEIPFYVQGKYDKLQYHFDDLIKIITKGLTKN